MDPGENSESGAGGPHQESGAPAARVPRHPAPFRLRATAPDMRAPSPGGRSRLSPGAGSGRQSGGPAGARPRGQRPFGAPDRLTSPAQPEPLTSHPTGPALRSRDAGFLDFGSDCLPCRSPQVTGPSSPAPPLSFGSSRAPTTKRSRGPSYSATAESSPGEEDRSFPLRRCRPRGRCRLRRAQGSSAPGRPGRSPGAPRRVL